MCFRCPLWSSGFGCGMVWDIPIGLCSGVDPLNFWSPRGYHELIQWPGLQPSQSHVYPEFFLSSPLLSTVPASQGSHLLNPSTLFLGSCRLCPGSLSGILLPLSSVRAQNFSYHMPQPLVFSGSLNYLFILQVYPQGSGPQLLLLIKVDSNPIMNLWKVCNSPSVHFDCTWHFHFVFLQFLISVDLPRGLSLSLHFLQNFSQ
jgi:hypothetical protein